MAKKNESTFLGGYQVLIDCLGCDEQACLDIDRAYDLLDNLPGFIGMRKMSQPYIFKTCEKAYPGRPGYSGWVALIESGIQIHTSAGNQFISLDVYSCRKINTEKLVAMVKGWCSPSKIKVQTIERGIFD